MKQLSGIVTSNKLPKTITVTVKRRRQHPLYKKTIIRTKKFLTHTDKPVPVGTQVIIQETRPLSHHKRWQVVKIENRKTETEAKRIKLS